MNKAIPILMVEDDVVDVKIMKRAFATNKLAHPLFVVSDGEQALFFLKNIGPYADASRAPRPGLIILDLNLPVMGGLEFLRTVKRDERLRRIPVVVLTSSNQEADVSASYDLSVAGYMMKRPDFSEFAAAVKVMESYWARCELPEGPTPALGQSR